MEVFQILAQFSLIVGLIIHSCYTLPNTPTVRRKCQTLPPAPPDDFQSSNTTSPWSQSSRQEERLQEILSRGMDQLELEKHDKNAIFVLGNTGSGKTTLTQLLNGNLSQLHAVRTHRGKLIVIDDNDRIGLPTTTSKTLVPEYVVNPEHNISFYDCPGFDDNRGAETDIAAMYFVNSITEHVDQAKFLFTVTHSSLIPGDDRLDFDLLVTHSSQFLLNMSKFEDSIGLIVTKVNSFSEWGEYLSDDELLSGIIEFIQQYQSDLQRQLNERETGLIEIELLQRKKQFIEAILKQGDDNQYPKIWFLRNPPQCGPYSEMPYMLEVRSNISNMILNDLEYSSSNSSDFGFTLKDKTRLKITSAYIPLTVTEMQNITVKLIKDLGESYETEFEKEFNSEQGMKEALLKLNQVNKDLELLMSDETQLLSSKDIQILFQIMDYTVPESYMAEIRKYDDVLKFYEKVTMTEIQRPSLLLHSSVTKLQNRLRLLRENTLANIQERIVGTITSGIRSSTTQIINELMESFQTDFQNEFNTEIGMRRVFTKLNVVYSTLQNFSSNQMQNHTHLNTEDIPKVFAIMGYPLNDSYPIQMREKESLLKFYENVTLTTIERPSLDYSIITLLNNIRDLKGNTWKYIQDEFIPQLVTRMNGIVTQLSGDYLQTYQTEFQREFNSSEYGMKEALRKLNEVHKRLLGFLPNQLNNSLLETSAIFSQKVERLFNTLEYSVPESYLVTLRQEEDLFNFYEEAGVSAALTLALDAHLSELRTRTQNMRESAWNYITQTKTSHILSEIETSVINHVNKLENCTLQHFYSDMNQITLSKKVEILNETLERLEKLGEQRVNESHFSSSSSLRILTEFGTLYNQLGCSMPIAEAAALIRTEERLDFWREVVESPIKSPIVERILKVAPEVAVKLGYVQSWFQFLVRVNTQLQNLTKAELNSVRNLTRNVSSTEKLLQSLQPFLPDLVSPNITQLFHFKVSDGLLLEKIVKNALSTIKIQCLFNGKKALVTGNHVRISDLMSSPNELPCKSNSSRLQDLEILASEVFSLDNDILAKGKSLTIRIIAERWDVIGTNRTIDLAGLDGEPYLKAQSGTNSSINGNVGEPGRPGGNGGNFFGVYGTIVNSEELTININGGDGGNGQEGGDGYTGQSAFDEDDHEMLITSGSGLGADWRRLLTCENMATSRANCVYKSKNRQPAATKGGNGGNGGSPGEGGFAGFFELIHVNTSEVHDLNRLSVSKRMGRIGATGSGGKGGIGGRKLSRFSCTNFLDHFILGCEPVTDAGRDSNGQNGLEGVNILGKVNVIQQPNATVAWNWETIIDFKRFILETGSVVGKQFVNVLNEVSNINIKKH